MGSRLIEIRLISLQRVNQMVLVEDNDSVKALFAHRTDPAFRIGVSSRYSKWRVNNFNVYGLEYRIEGQTVLPIIVTDEMSK